MAFACRPIARFLGAGALLALLAGAGSAQDRPRAGWLSGEQVRNEFTGRLLNGIYPSGVPWSEFLSADGSTDYREGEKHWRGQWWVDGRTFCFRYPPPGVGGCFGIVRLGLNCYELYERRGIAHDDTPPAEANAWNGRMWDAGRPATCDEQPTS